MLRTPVKPMLLTMQRESFDDDRYIFEPKWDGWRILIHKEGDSVEAYTRHGRRVTEKFPELRELAGGIGAHSAVLDAEGICLRDGRPVFDDFAYRGRLADQMKIERAAQRHPATFVTWDVLHINGTDLIHRPLTERKERLQELIRPSGVLMPTMFVEGKGRALHQLTIDKDLEGIVAKRKDSTYQLDTRSADWIKIKNWKTIDTVILGYRTEPQFALVVGLNFPTVRNKPVAVVEFGFKCSQPV